MAPHSIALRLTGLWQKHPLPQARSLPGAGFFFARYAADPHHAIAAAGMVLFCSKSVFLEIFGTVVPDWIILGIRLNSPG